MNYFDWIEGRMSSVKARPRNVDDVVEWTPVDVSEMQGIVVGRPSEEEARMLMNLFGAEWL